MTTERDDPAPLELPASLMPTARPEFTATLEAEVAVVCAFEAEARVLGAHLRGWAPMPHGTFFGWRGRDARGMRWVIFCPQHPSPAACRAATLQARRLAPGALVLARLGRGLRLTAQGPLPPSDPASAHWVERAAGIAVPRLIYSAQDAPPQAPAADAETLSLEEPLETPLAWQWAARHLAPADTAAVRWLDRGAAAFATALHESIGLPHAGTPPVALSLLVEPAAWPAWPLEEPLPSAGQPTAARRQILARLAAAVPAFMDEIDAVIERGRAAR